MKHVEQLKVLFAGEPVGILALRQRQYWFQYDAYWLQHGFNLAPQVMAFDNVPQLAKSPVFQGLHGVFYDSLPDGWGLLLMDRFFKQQYGWDRHEVTGLDRLAYLGKRAMGALEFEPVLANEVINEEIQLDVIAEEAERVLQGDSHAVVTQLRILGGSPGGARPKVTVALAAASNQCVAGYAALPSGFNHWLVKFHSMTDPADMGCIEKAYAELAALAGIVMPSSRLIQVKHSDEREELFFAVQRFDRAGEIKYHMLTLCGFLYADFRLPALDYHALLAAAAVLTKDMREVERAFRLMVFNVAVHNKDDHAKNFAFICDREGVWRLAPGYDLTFSMGMNNEHTTSINGSGNPSWSDIAAVAAAHGIQHGEKIVAEVLAAVKQWKAVAEKYQVSASSQALISNELAKIKHRLASC
jgi:serine/threonine-protein kinase HipA